ncbi:MAG: ice-binding family protein, partial [Bacteroidales bacterium]|nr:ice-binding family protein [Bacteroidales bacterium]
TFIISGNRTLVANYANILYTVTLSANPLAGGTPSGGGTFNYGNSVTVKANPAVGYTFTKWTEIGTIVSTTAEYTFTISVNRILVANYTINNYTLNVTANNGTVVKNPNQATYNYGTTVTLTPTPNTGYTFTSWSGDATGSANPLTVTMDANKNITANFTLNTYSLNVVALNGVVVKNPDQTAYDHGTTVTLTATANSGYTFTGWSGDAAGTISPTSVLMNANKNITANYTLISAVCPTIVDLGTSGNYVILTKAGISTTGVTSVTGNMGVSPITSTAITGFGLILPAGGAFSTSSLVTGNIYAPDYASPTPANLTTAVGNMETAYTTANGLVVPAPTTELLAGNLNGQTLTKGIYKWGTGVSITNGITLDGGGDACATWIFQIAEDLTVANGAIISLTNGADAKNIFWVVAGSKAALGTTVDFSGNILCKTLISLNTGAKVTGRLLAQTEVTLIASTVVLP